MKNVKEEIGYFVLFLIVLILATLSMLWLYAMLEKYPEGLPWL